MVGDHIRQMSGAEVPIRREDRMAGDPTTDQAWILIGEGKLTEKFGLSSKGLGPGGIVLSAQGPVLALFGTDARTPSDPHGTRSAVTTFLEEKLGVRYLWPGELGKVVPRRQTIVAADFQHRFTPLLAQRGIFAAWATITASRSDWIASVRYCSGTSAAGAVVTSSMCPVTVQLRHHRGTRSRRLDRGLSQDHPQLLSRILRA